MRLVNKPMKRLSLYLFLIFFTLQTPSQADDIRDFQIEGMSVGDSLLGYFSEEKITNSNRYYSYLDNEFYAVGFDYENSFEVYNTVEIHLKTDDKKYKIFMIRGMLDYVEDLEGCLKKQKEIANEIEKILTQYEKTEKSAISKIDPSGKSKYYYIKYYWKNGDDLVVQCNDWDEEIRKKNDWTEGLSVAISTKEFNDWISDY